jgi:hypothetical protein
MTKPLSVLATSTLAVCFAWSAIPAFAQHGGGHGGGGGFHGGGGGGGFHGSASAHSSGGGGPRSGSYSPPSSGYGAPRSPGGYASRPSNGFSRPGNSFAGGNQRVGNSASAPPAVADGRWHSFSGEGANRSTSGAQSQGATPNNAEGFHVFSGNRGAGSSGAVRNFSGQGNEVYENAPAARNIVPKSQSLSSLHNSFGGSRTASSNLRPNSTLSASASSHAALGSALTGNRGLSNGLNRATSVQQFSSSNRFGAPFGGFRGGCWNCGIGFRGWGNRWGFGFGGGWGYGWPWLGFWGWDPFIYDPWWGWPAPGYGYYGYPNANLYADPNSGYYAPDDNSSPSTQQYDQDNSDGNVNGNWSTPNGPSSSAAQNSANLAVPVLIYMKNGAVYSARDYWIVDDELNYILMDGAQHAVDLDRVDLPRTNTENAKSGVKFIFKSEPSVPTVPPAPAPTQELNAVPQPEART